MIDAIRLMAEKGIGALLVTDEGRLVGVVSERDYARKVVLQGRSSSSTTVREIMTANPTCVAPGDAAEYCMQLMTDLRVRHLPVMHDGRLLGVVSIGDLVKAVIEEQQIRIDDLEGYIVGRR